MGSQGSSGSGGSKQLLLCRCDVQDGDQVYIARGLSIGRSPDNTFVIDDPQVCRHHCQVEFDAGGQMVLRCVDPGAELLHNDQHVRELPLVAGLRFRVGPAEFECRAATPSEPAPENWLARCPFCGSTTLPEPAPEVQACRDCGHEVMVFRPRGMGLACIAGSAGPFKLVRLAGEGGMGVVFEGVMPEKGQRVAVKLLHPRLAADRDALRRFEREIELLRQIKHPHLVTVIGFGKWKTHPALITEWLSGGNLAQVFESHRIKGALVEFRQAAKWLAEACQGLAAIHAAGLVHRDIKPSNLLLTAEGHLKIADLGLAKVIGQETTALTVTSLAVGSPRYMAPEQWTNPGGVDRRADIYALGVTFYELLTGKLPLGAWQPASAINPSVPPWFDAVLQKMLAVDPQNRFSDISISELFAAWAALGASPRVPPAAAQSRVPTSGQRAAKPDQAPGSPPQSPSPLVNRQYPDSLAKDGTVRAARPLVPEPSRWAPLSGRLRSPQRLLITILACAAIILLAIVGSIWFPASGAPTPNGSSDISAGPIQSTHGPPDGANGAPPPALKPTLFVGHLGWPTSAAFSPDGRRIVTASTDQTAIVWDATTGQQMLVLKAHSHLIRIPIPLSSAAFSPDGRSIVTATADGTAIVWDATTGQQMRVLKGHAALVLSAAFSPDGRRIVTAPRDRTAIVWDATTGQQMLVLKGHADLVNSADFSPDGRRIVTASIDGSVRVWDAETGQEIAQLWALQGGEWLAVTPEGYFQGSPGAQDLVRHQDASGKFLEPGESRRYHRPDLVRQALAGSGPPGGN